MSGGTGKARPAAASGARRAAAPYFTPMSEGECVGLLESSSIGRIGWQAADGPQVLPVTYVFRDGFAYLRTSPHGILSELVQPTDVALEVDDLDAARRTGWSIVVHGQARGVAAPSEISRLWEMDDLVPWAPGGRSLFIQVRPTRISGRLLRRLPRE